MGVDGRQIFLVIKSVHEGVISLLKKLVKTNVLLQRTHHPTTRSLQMDSSVGVHGGLQELAGPQVPEEH